MRLPLTIVCLLLLVMHSQQALAQQFEAKEITKVPGFRVTADLNNDGHTDVVSMQYDLKIYWGTPSLDIGQGQTIGQGVSYLEAGTTCEVARINNDAYLDIVVSQPSPNRLLVYLNNQDGTFSLTVIPIGETNPVFFSCYDLDANGTKDLLYFELNSYYPSGNAYYKMFSIFNNNGNFGAATYQRNVPASDRKIYDMDADGREDLMIYPHVYLNVPGNPFEYNPFLSDVPNLSSAVTDAICTDLNNDGLTDYVYIHNSAAVFSVLRTEPDIPIVHQPSQITGSYGVKDLIRYEADGDPYPEFLVTSAQQVHLLNFNPVTEQLESSPVYGPIDIGSLDVTDFNSDGHQDLLIQGNSSGELSVVEGNGTGAFGTRHRIMFSNEANGFAVDEGDIDGNGLNDLVFYSGYGLACTKQLTPGHYSNLQMVGPAYEGLQIDLSDIDLDGDLDLILLDYYYYTSETNDDLFKYFLNDGSGNFSAPVTIMEDVSGQHQKIADMDNDGYPDVVLFNSYTSTGRILYFRNTHPGFVLQQTVVAISATNMPFELVDMDNNGYKDVLVLNGTTLTTYSNTAGTLGAGVTSLTLPQIHTSLLAVDLDNDADTDFISKRAGSANQIGVIHNNGGTLSYQAYTVNPGYLDDVSYMDFDHDGLQDIIFALGNSMGVLKNTGSVTFAAPVYHPTAMRMVQFKEIRNSAGAVTNIIGQDFIGALYGVEEFVPGATPLLAQDTFDVCPGEAVIITVTNGTALNDNAEWGLFSGSCDGELLSTSAAGLFTFSSDENATYYVKAIGNSTYSGNCSTLTFNVSGSNPAVDVTTAAISDSAIVLNIVSPQAELNWEYQLDGGAWSPVVNTANTLTVNDLQPNTDYELNVRPAGTMGGCTSWPSELIAFATACPVNESYDTVLACPWSTIQLPGFQSYTAQDTGSTNHTIVVPTADGCDSILHITVTVPVLSSESSLTACAPFTWIDGNTYAYGETFDVYHSVPSSLGCDSLIILHLTLVQPVYHTDIQSACGPFTWIDGTTYFTSNYTATDTLISTLTGCDSIVTLNLSIAPLSGGPDVQTACGSFTWTNGVTYLESNNTAIDTLISAEGCDSIVTLDLTIIPLSYGTDVQTACGHYTWIDGITYTASNNTATDTLTSILTGCDSIVTLDLTILPLSGSTQTVTELHSYLWPLNGTTYTVSGTYTDTLTSALTGCDSIITLELTITTLTVNTFTTPADMGDCTGTVSITAAGVPDFTFDIGGGVTPVVSSDGTATFTDLCPGVYSVLTTDGNGDTLGTVFVVPTSEDFIFIDPFGGSAPILDSLGVTVESCDIDFESIDTAYIISYTLIGTDTLEVAWSITDQFGSFLIPAVYVLPGGAGNYYLQLQLYCPEKSTGEGFVVTEGVSYSGDDISTLSLTDLEAGTVLLYPNPSAGAITCVFSGQQATFTVSDLQGKVLSAGEVQPGGTIDLSAFATGIYVVELGLERGTYLQRVVKM